MGININKVNKKIIDKEHDLIRFGRKNWALLLAIIYFFLPIDFIPDILPAFGYGDDILVLFATLFIRYRKFKKERKESTVIDGEIINE